MSCKSLTALVISASILAICAIVLDEIVKLESPSLFPSVVVYAALITPTLCQILPIRWARLAWAASIGVLLAGLWGAAGAHNLFDPQMLPVLLVLGIVLIAYSILINRIASWEAESIRSLALVVRNNLVISEAIERERLRQCEGMLALCQRLNLPLSILHLNWVPVEPSEGRSFRISKNEPSFLAHLEKLRVRDSLFQHVGAATRVSDIVLSDGTQNGLFVVCPATPENGAEVLSTRLETILKSEFQIKVKHSVATTDSNGFALANLMLAAKTSKPNLRPVTSGAVVSLR
jgi:hypothetical protein